MEAAAEIAELYAPADGVAMPIETLMADSEGAASGSPGTAAGRRPRRRSNWKPQRARPPSIKVGCAPPRGRWREASPTSSSPASGPISTWSRSRSIPSAPEVCPFRGLAPFDAAHAEYFFGRERLVAELVARLVGSTLIAVVGPSGSGKSSVLRAGFCRRWPTGCSRLGAVAPGDDEAGRAPARGARPRAGPPRARGEPGQRRRPLAAGLDSLGPDERLVLAVDQLEEIFTACRDEAERAAFADALAASPPTPISGPSSCSGSGATSTAAAPTTRAGGADGRQHRSVGPMRRDELRRAIELPAKRGFGSTSLVSALVGDVAEEPGGCRCSRPPWWSCGRSEAVAPCARRATASGGVSGAVARLAERAYRRLSEPQRERARAILLRLADAEEAAPVRRRVPLAELETERDEDAAAALAS